MPSVAHGTTWPADLHTLAKIEILKGYLNAYFPILGCSKRGQNILLVDGFAGPGEYTNASEGSPIAMLRTATAAIANGTRAWIAGDVTCAFIEPDEDRCQRLRDRLKKVRLNPKIRTEVFEKTFVEGIAALRQSMPRPFTTGDPLFVFIDPFGATGVPFETVTSILSTPCSEVLINLDSDGIMRNFPVPGQKDFAQRESLMTSVFGDESWRTEITSTNFKTQCQQVLELYKKKLRAIRAVEYVFSFEMRGSDDTLNYHLVFASQNPLGLEKMKEAMLSIDKSGSYSFSDGQINQITMFRFDHPEDFASKLHKNFVGRDVSYPAIHKFALNETPFYNPIKMLKVLDDWGQIEVTRFDPTKKGFSDEHVRAVRFLNQPPRPTKVSGKMKQESLFGD
ncbi:MAG TPA: three-Cys-motif partner protein TcmP [Tepidisphaeraceae bacterium]